MALNFKPATILKFHKALVERKYSKLYSNKIKKTAGRKPQDDTLIDLVIEMKKLNSSFGYGRIAMQIYEALASRLVALLSVAYYVKTKVDGRQMKALHG